MMSEEMAVLKWRERQITEELEEKKIAYKVAVRAYKERDKALISERIRAETRIKSMEQIIHLEQNLQVVAQKKVKLLEEKFSQGEEFLMKLDNFLGKLKGKVNQSQHVSQNMAQQLGEVDLVFLDSQRNQHKQNLKQIVHYYDNFQKNFNLMKGKVENQREFQDNFQEEVDALIPVELDKNSLKEVLVHFQM